MADTTAETPAAPVAEAPAAPAPVVPTPSKTQAEEVKARGERNPARTGQRLAEAMAKAIAERPAAPVEAPKASDGSTPEPATATPPEAKAEQLSPKLAALVKKEREAMEAKQRLDARETQLREREAKAQAYEESMRRAASDPDAALKALGWTTERLMDFKLNGGKPTAEMLAESDKAGVEAVRAEVDALKQQQYNARLEVAQNNYMSGAENYAKAQGDKYETFLAYGHEAKEIAVELFRELTTKRGTPAQYEEVIALVDAHLEQRAAPALTTKRFKAKLSPVAPPPAATTAESKSGPAKFPPRTLTNSSVAAAPVGPVKTKSQSALKSRLEAALRDGFKPR